MYRLATKRTEKKIELSGQFMSKSIFGQQGCRALTFALARLSCAVLGK